MSKLLRVITVLILISSVTGAVSEAGLPVSASAENVSIDPAPDADSGGLSRLRTAEAVSTDDATPPVPLPGDCLGVTPPGETPPACCVYGYVYYDGLPVAGATVKIDSPYGSLNATTASGPLSDQPYYKVNLSGTPLLVSPGDTVTVTATYGGRSVSTAYLVAQEGQQVDIVIVTNSTQLFGNGSDGDLTVIGVHYTDDTRTAMTSTANVGQQVLNVVSTAGFAVGQEVLVIQMQGTGAGSHEFGAITSIGSGTLTLGKELANTYTVGSSAKAQVLRVPHYRNLMIQNGGTLAAHAWDGGTGGVLIFKASGQIIVAAGGNVTMSGKGYVGPGANWNNGTGIQGEGINGVGASSYLRNGNSGGGGESGGDGNVGGGGGGGHGSDGEVGGHGSGATPYWRGGEGGIIVGEPELLHWLMGGAGGSGGDKTDTDHYGGAAGSGGGIIAGFAPSLQISGTIASDGTAGGQGLCNCGTGGAGAGGSIYLVGQSVVIGGNVSAVGGPHVVGNCADGWGGAGGAGRIRVEYSDLLSGTTNPSANTQQRALVTGPIVTINTIYPQPAIQGQSIVTFRGAAVDNDEDGASITAYVWRSDIDGLLSTQASFTRTASSLSAGTHTIYFKAKDNENEWSSEVSRALLVSSSSRVPPTARVHSIEPNPAIQGRDVITFTGSGTANGDATSIVAYNWWTSLNEQISTQPVFTLPASSLVTGTHIVSFTVRDNLGDWSSAVTRTLVINSQTDHIPPVASILSITPDPATQSQDIVAFAGSGMPNASATSITAYRWWSSRNGQLSTQASFTLTASSLATGTHIISFTVQDNLGDWSDAVTRTLGINPAQSITATWTMMLYLDGDNNLQPWLNRAKSNLESLAANPNIRIVMLLDGHGNNNTVRYLVQPGGSYTEGVNRWYMGELNMGDPATLASFVVWARTNYPAQHYYLSVADHGRGTTGIAWDDTAGHDYLTTVELKTALNTATSGGANKLDVVHYDACLMAMLEDAYQLRNYADYFVASENLGWSVFAYDDYANLVTRDLTPAQLATGIATAYAADVAAYPHTISVMDLSRVEATADAVDSLAGALRAHLPNITSTIRLARDAAQPFDSRDYYRLDDKDEYRDLYDLAARIKFSVPYSDVQAAAQAVMDAISGTVLAEHHRSGWINIEGQDRYWKLDDAHGVSIYFPPRSNGWDYNQYVNNNLFDFTVGTHWDEFLVDYFGLTGLIEPEPTDPGTPPMMARPFAVYLPLVIR